MRFKTLEPLNLRTFEPKIGTVKKKYFFFTVPIFQFRI